MLEPVSPQRNRLGIAGLVLSASGFVFTVMHEGYTSQAVIPVKGDVPTIGFGTTSGVKMGDKITPPLAVERALIDEEQDELGIHKCIHVPLTQGEYDSDVDGAYNAGVHAFCESSIAKKQNAGDYSGACQDYLAWRITVKGVENKGLLNRRLAEYNMCLGTQPKG